MYNIRPIAFCVTIVSSSVIIYVGIFNRFLLIINIEIQTTLFLCVRACMCVCVRVRLRARVRVLKIFMYWIHITFALHAINYMSHAT